MSRAAALALLAMLSGAANAAAPAGDSLAMTVCGAPGEPVRTVRIPLPPTPAPGKDCRDKACHAATSRKRSACHF